MHFPERLPSNSANYTKKLVCGSTPWMANAEGNWSAPPAELVPGQPLEISAFGRISATHDGITAGVTISVAFNAGDCGNSLNRIKIVEIVLSSNDPNRRRGQLTGSAIVPGPEWSSEVKDLGGRLRLIACMDGWQVIYLYRWNPHWSSDTVSDQDSRTENDKRTKSTEGSIKVDTSNDKHNVAPPREVGNGRWVLERSTWDKNMKQFSGGNPCYQHTSFGSSNSANYTKKLVCGSTPWMANAEGNWSAPPAELVPGQPLEISAFGRISATHDGITAGVTISVAFNAGDCGNSLNRIKIVEIVLSSNDPNRRRGQLTGSAIVPGPEWSSEVTDLGGRLRLIACMDGWQVIYLYRWNPHWSSGTVSDQDRRAESDNRTKDTDGNIEVDTNNDGHYVAPSPGRVMQIFNNGNIDAVGNSPTEPTVVNFQRTVWISKVTTYHWNRGRGTEHPGYIALVNSKGKMYGPWQAVGAPGVGGVPNAYWSVSPGIELPPGSYMIVDSDSDTWAQNAGSRGAGHAWIDGEVR